MSRTSIKLLLTAFVWYQLCNFTSAACPLTKFDFPNGEIVYEKPSDVNLTVVTQFYILDFKCDVGYQKTEPSVIVCVNGKWNEEPPSCNKLECPSPPVISNSNFQIHEGVDNVPIVSSLVNYVCVHGYELANQSQSSLTCVMNGHKAVWDGIIPECIVTTSCPNPGKSPHGSRQGDCCYVGHVVTFSCNDDYELIGNQSLECLLGGNWSSQRPRCRPLEGSCPDPPVIANGKVEGIFGGDYYIPYDEAEVVCNPGFGFFGVSQYIECTEELEWEYEFGKCRESFCKRPSIPENGTIVELEQTNATLFPYKFDINYACDQGFRLIGSNHRFCNKERWSDKSPYCEAIKCYDPGVPDNGMREGSDFTIGQKVVFTCFSGSSLLGSVERYCQPNGQWTGELTRCNYESNYCPDPGIPINGIKIGINYDRGDKVQFRCQPGFSLVGDKEWECLENGTWSHDEVKCLGPYDFDNEVDVRNILGAALEEKVKEQKKELAKHYRAHSLLEVGVRTSRILDLANNGKRLIFYFVFDVSGSVGMINFKTSIEFAKTLVKKVNVTEHGARVGAMTFSSKSNLEFYPTHYKKTEDVLNALDRINYTRGGTATNSVLKQMREGVIPLTREHLKNTKTVIFILTDGKTNTGGNPVEEAKKLKDAGVEIYCIGITGSILKNSLYSIASEPQDEHVFILNDYRTLDFLVQKLTQRTVDYSKCGLGLDKVRKKGQRSRIIGGSQVVDPWPWMAAIYITDNDPRDAKLQCGGSIIGKKWILTAAHCLLKVKDHLPRPREEIIVKLGLTHVEEHSKLQEFEPARLHVHPQYNSESFDNDIAVIELNRDIEYNQDVRPICLPPKDITANSSLYKENEIAFVTGWGVNKTVEIGAIAHNLAPTKNLKELRLPIKSREQCKQSMLNQKMPEEAFTKNMFCAGTGDETGDTCQGDSGGPLMQSQVNKDGNVYWTEVGIVSSGFGCGQKNQYGLYTHVHELLPWIKRVINAKNS